MHDNHNSQVTQNCAGLLLSALIFGVVFFIASIAQGSGFFMAYVCFSFGGTVGLLFPIALMYLRTTTAGLIFGRTQAEI